MLVHNPQYLALGAVTRVSNWDVMQVWGASRISS
jgi:hypothetical protein